MDTIRVPRRYLMRDPEETQYRHFKFVRRLMDLVILNRKKKRTRDHNAYFQIYSARFFNQSAESLNQIRGSLIVNGCALFERQIGNDDPHHINKLGFVRLRGPMCTIDAEGAVFFYPKVFRKDHPENLFHPDSGVTFGKNGMVEGEIPSNDKAGVYGNFLISERSLPDICNEVLCEVMTTSCGFFNLTYAAFDDGADCFLTLKLLEWNDEGPGANVYGQIKTSNTMFRNDPRAVSLVYDRKRDENERVQPEQYIELQRPVSVLPMGHHLNVELNLMHENGDPQSDFVIAKTTLSFRAKCTREKGTSRRYEGISESRKISGKWGKVELRVFWLPSWNFEFASSDDDGSCEECS